MLTAVVSRVQRLGASAIGFGVAAAQVGALLWGALIVIPLHSGRQGLRVVVDLVVKQLYFTGVQGLPLVGLAALALGTLIISEANAYLPVEYAPSTAAHILAKDVVPLAVAFIVLPRLIGGVLSMLALVTYGLLVATGAGYALSKGLAPLPFSLEAVVSAISVSDLALGATKGLLFGAGFVLVAIREGYSVESSSREIPQATTRAVVRGMGLCLVLNSVLSVLS